MTAPAISPVAAAGHDGNLTKEFRMVMRRQPSRWWWVLGISSLAILAWTLASLSPAQAQEPPGDVDPFHDEKSIGLLPAPRPVLLPAPPPPPLPAPCSSTTTINGNVTVVTQADADALAGVGIINGRVTIMPGNNVLDLSAFDELVQVTDPNPVIGSSEILFKNFNAQPLISGFPCLANAPRGLVFEDNEAVEQIEGFNALQNGGPFFRRNASLQGVSGFNNMTGRSITATDNPVLEVISGFAALVQLDILRLSLNPLLMTLPDFATVESIGNFSFEGNTSFLALGGFDQVSTITSISIVGNTNLVSIPTFPNLKSIATGFFLFGNDSLSALSGFGILESIGDKFEVFLNNALLSITGFGNLQTIGTPFGGDLTIGGNASLTSIDGFNALTSVVGDLIIGTNAALDSIGGFTTLLGAGIAGTSTITNNPLFDCSIPPQSGLPFLPVDVSAGNLVDCPVL